MGMRLIGAQSSSLGGLIGQLLSQFSSSGRDDVLSLLNRYLFSTVDVSRPGSQPLTGNPALASLNQSFCKAGDVLLVLVIVVIAVRGIVDHSMYSQHDLRALLPTLLLGVFLMNASLTLIQAAVDFNNALAWFAQTAGGGPSGHPMPWTDPLSPAALTSTSLAQDLFEVVVVLALVVTLGLLAISYVIRMAVLEVLIATAPFAALATILPETKGTPEPGAGCSWSPSSCRRLRLRCFGWPPSPGSRRGAGWRRPSTPWRRSGSASRCRVSSPWRRASPGGWEAFSSSRRGGSRCPCRLAAPERGVKVLRLIATITAVLAVGLSVLGGVAAGSTSGFGYPAGQCTAYVASRLSWIPSDWGDADQWLSDASDAGFTTIRGSDVEAVLPGDVAIIAAGTRTSNGTASNDGHVGIVIAIDQGAGTVTLSSENWPEGDHTPRSLTFAAADIEGYIARPSGET